MQSPEEQKAEILGSPEGKDIVKIASELASHMYPPKAQDVFLDTVKDSWVQQAFIHSSWIAFANALEEGEIYATMPTKEAERGFLSGIPIRDIHIGRIPESENLYLVYADLSGSHRQTTFAALVERKSREAFGKIIGMYATNQGYASSQNPEVRPMEELEQILNVPQGSTIRDVAIRVM